MPEAVPELPEVITETVTSEDSTSEPTGEGGGGTWNPRRKRFSEKYPFRRVKMNPEPGIRAKAAGTLIWPKATSPLQQLLSH